MEEYLMNLPKITVITPSFNQGMFLEETIKSVLDQNYPNLEYLVYDGGSADKSVDIIKKYEDKIDFWVSQKDKGQSDAINKGFQRATGDIITWLNSDDVFIPNVLNEITDYFLQHPWQGAVSGDIININSNSEELFVKKLIDLHYIEMIFSSVSVPQPATFFRKSALDQVGLLDLNLKYNMDLDFFIRMKKAGVKFGRINKPLTKFRLHSESKTVTEFSNKVEQANYFIKAKHFNFQLKRKERSLLLKLFRFFFRSEIYLRKILQRGELLPYRHTRLVKKL